MAALAQEHVEARPARRSLLIVEDDRRLAEYLFRIIAPLGFRIDVAESFEQAVNKARLRPPDHALVDARIPGGSGVNLIKPLRDFNPNMRIVLCTGYPSIASTVQAMRLGAVDYLVKPVSVEQVLAAFGGEMPPAEETNGDAASEARASEAKMLSLARARWEYIHMVLANCEGNVAAAARHLGIHRQSLQRMLKKCPPTE
jgi:two-component system response regulator RegA